MIIATSIGDVVSAIAASMVLITNGVSVNTLGAIASTASDGSIATLISTAGLTGITAVASGGKLYITAANGYDFGIYASGTSNQISDVEARFIDVSGIVGWSSFNVAINDGSTAVITGLTINNETITTVSLAQGVSLVNGLTISGNLIVGMDSIANTDTAFLNAMINAINDATDTTNVTARAGSGTSLILTADEGKNIEIGRISGVMTTVASFYDATGLATDYYALATATTTYNGESSAIAKVAAIDSIKSSTAVDTLVVATTTTGTAAVALASLSAGDLYINGIDIGAVTVLAGDASGALLAAINSKSSTTGVSASLDSSNRLVLSADDGRNISVVQKAAALASTGINDITDDHVYRGGVKLNSSENFTIAGSTSDLGGIATKTYTTSLDYAISLIDLSTQTGADDALASLDAAVYQINTTRSQLGAIQSRVSLVIMNLTTTVENLSASESRIRDVDFAEETSVLTRNSILTQAATAILAQANQLPQLALQLLGG
jgi:flagellin